MSYSKTNVKNLALVFLVTLALSLAVMYNKQGVAQSSPSSIPSSGSCALLMTLPVPYGFNVANNQGKYQTGYNFIGKITFNSSSSGSFSGQGINPTFNTGNSPYIESAGGVINMHNFSLAITPMTNSNGFEGGYIFTFSGNYNGNPLTFRLVGVPSNSGNTIVMVSEDVGTVSSPGIGPGSGVCQV
jgi:hypothetical protein